MIESYEYLVQLQCQKKKSTPLSAAAVMLSRTSEPEGQEKIAIDSLLANQATGGRESSVLPASNSFLSFPSHPRARAVGQRSVNAQKMAHRVGREAGVNYTNFGISTK